MPDTPADVRTAARALIVRDGGILLLRKEYEDGRVRYALPGGAQEYSETLLETLGRECFEEIGVDVQVIRLAHMAEYFRRRSAQPDQTRHLLECLYLCEVPADYTPVNGDKPDQHQVSVEWLPLSRLHEAQLSHPFLTEEVASGSCQDVYLGVFRDQEADA